MENAAKWRLLAQELSSIERLSPVSCVKHLRVNEVFDGLKIDHKWFRPLGSVAVWQIGNDVTIRFRYSISCVGRLFIAPRV